jgi:hypothetical protein
MSLAMYAAPFDNDINIVNKDDSLIGRKRANRTMKRMPSPKENNYSEKVNSVLQTIHNLPPDDEPLADFNPPPPPQSAGVEQTKMKENSQPNSGMNFFDGQPSQNSKPQFLNDSENGNQLYSGELEKDQNGNLENYQRFMPNYGEMYKKPSTNTNMPYSGSSIMAGGFNSSMMYGSGNSSDDKNDLLMEKLNYMIKLLEEQQDERTGNVTEEVILYSFLGIFIIFIVDSFARVGKYVR